MYENLEKLFDTFVLELQKREGFLSEDNIRFYWFVSMYEQDHNLNHFSLEEHYSETGKKKGHKELDLMYENDHERLCIEIKFHRNPSGEEQKSQTFAKTQAAGEIFDDICRLPHWTGISNDNKRTHYLFLYVTDDEMDRYLSNATGQRNKTIYRVV